MEINVSNVGREETLNTSFAVCRAMTKRHARSFYFASHALPRKKRREAYAIYAFCRHVDDEIDLAKDEAALETALLNQRRLLDELENGGAGHYRWAPAFVATWKARQIPRIYFEDLLTGMALDRGQVRVVDWEELDRYCYHVAGVVGLIMTHIFVDRERIDAELLARARDLGTAMQLTNILRDIGEDYARDRIYLPRTELAQFGVSEDDLAEGRVTDSFRQFIRFQITRARTFYDQAEAGIRRLPGQRTRQTVWSMRLIYAAILDEIEKADFQVFAERAHVSFFKKLRLACAAWWKSWSTT